MRNILETPEMADLLTLVEESARSTEAGVKHFVEPAPGTLNRTINKRHHIVFGRRGSGKSSLLQKAAADLTVDFPSATPSARVVPSSPFGGTFVWNVGDCPGKQR